MAVLVQRLIEPTASGVCFTINPLTNHPTEMTIEAVYGFGDALANGTVTPDGYLYETDAKAILRRTIAKQEKKIGLSNGDVCEIPVALSDQDSQKLTDDQIHELAASCLRIAGHFGVPQDIEFAFSAGDLCFLQARPITAPQRSGV